MASGKTTVGELLAHELGWSFADLDADIESAQGTKIAEIFDRDGEEHFRQIEHETVRKRVSEVVRGKPMVLALGGGTYTQLANKRLLDENGVTIWLDCAYDRLCARLGDDGDRPLARDPVKFRQLFEDRQSCYSQAEYRIEVDTDDPAAIVAAILKLPIF